MTTPVLCRLLAHVYYDEIFKNLQINKGKNMESPSNLCTTVNDTTLLKNTSDVVKHADNWMGHKVKYCWGCEIKKFDAVMIHAILTTLLTTAGLGSFGYIGSYFDIETKVIVPLIFTVGALSAFNCALGVVYIVKGKFICPS